MRVIILAVSLLATNSAYASDCSVLSNAQMYAAIVHQSRDLAGADHTCICPGDRVGGKRCMTRTTKGVKCMVSDVTSNDVVAYCNK